MTPPVAKSFDLLVVGRSEVLFSTRLGLMKPDLTDAASIADINANTDAIDNLCLPVLCTSTTRPSTPLVRVVGTIIYETDTELLRIWNGTIWKWIGGTLECEAKVNSFALTLASTNYDANLNIDITANTLMHSTGTNPNRMILPMSGGTFLVTVSFTFTGNTGVRYFRYLKNNVLVTTYNIDPVSAGSTPVCYVIPVKTSAPGDYVNFQVQSSVTGSSVADFDVEAHLVKDNA